MEFEPRPLKLQSALQHMVFCGPNERVNTGFPPVSVQDLPSCPQRSGVRVFLGWGLPPAERELPLSSLLPLLSSSGQSSGWANYTLSS